MNADPKKHPISDELKEVIGSWKDSFNERLFSRDYSEEQLNILKKY